MSSKADFNLVVGAELSASYEEMRKDLKVIINTLNKQPYKIKLGLDMASASKDVNKLKTDISELSKSAANIKFSDQISNSLNNITANLKTLTESVAGVSGLKGELLALSEAMRSFQGISINLTSGKNPVQQMSQYGKAAREYISELKAQATEMERVLSRIYGGTGTGALQAASKGTPIWRMAKTDSISLQKALGDSSNLRKQIDTYVMYINMMKSVAKYRQIDMTPILRLEELEKGYDAVEKLRTGEKQATDDAEKLKNIFGSGINSDALISKLEEIRLSIERITTSLTELNSKEIKIKVDEASINSIKAEITQLVTQITEAAAKLNVVKTTKKTSSSSTSTSTKSQYQEASKAIKEYYSLLTELSKTETDITKVDGNYVSPSGKWEKLAASLNRVAAAFETLTGAESRNTMTSDEQAKLTQQLAAAEDEYQRKLEASTNKSEEAAARKEREAAAAEEAARAKREEAEAVKAAKAAQEEETRTAREAEAERKAAEATIRNYNNAVVQGESAIKRWSAAEHSRSKSSRDAYKKLIDSLNNLKSAESQYGSGSKEVAEATSNFKRTLKETQAVLISNGDATQSLTTKFGSLAKKFGSWLTVSQAIMYAVRAVKKMVSTAKEIDYALTQLKIVTNATDNEMKQFADTAITLSKNLGKSVTELTKSIETFSRLGYSLKDASELAKYATIMSNVAGVGNDEATTGITSIVKGFNLNVSDAEHVADVLVEVGQKYAVSAGELMEAYEKSGAALSATNTSLEKSAGLIAAANASVQDASIVGTALKTVSARIRGKNFCASVYSNIHAQARQAA